MALDDIIFDDKTLSDMFADVYKNVGAKREQITSFITKLVPLIRTPEDAVVIAPVIREFFDASIKNDEHIVRLVQIAQRIGAISAKDSAGESTLTSQEIEQLMTNVQKGMQSVVDEQDELEDTIDRLTK